MIAGTALETVFRSEHGLVLAALTKTFGDLDLAEESLQDAVTAALEAWPVRGVPDNPAAWLTTAARRKGIDRIRRRQTLRRKAELLAQPGTDESGFGALESHDDLGVGDERLRLMFTCCHPALALEAKVALTLRTLGGLTTAEIARAFLVTEKAMYQRITRAKRKIKAAGIPYEVPTGPELGQRLRGVLAVIYLIFNEGYTGSSGPELVRTDLCQEAIRLAATLAALMPDEPEVLGLLALTYLTEARRPARTMGGELVVLAEQDRSLWDRDLLGRGRATLIKALRLGRPGPYQLQAAIAAVHADADRAEQTDWMQIAALYGELLRRDASPVVSLNHAVAVAMWRGPETGLSLLESLGEELDHYHLFHAAADLLRRRLETKRPLGPTGAPFSWPVMRWNAVIWGAGSPR